MSLSIEVGFDDSGARRKVADMRRSLRDAAREAGGGLVGLYLDVVLPLLPEDTRRLKRGTVEAHNAAAALLGAPARPLPSLRPSRRRAEFLEALVDQADHWRAEVGKWRGWEEHYTRDGRQGEPYYRKIGQRLRFAERRLEKSLDNLERFGQSETALLFVPGGLQVGRHAERLDRQGRRRLITVRDRYYGGTARVDLLGTRLLITLEIAEPHARIVERRHGRPYRTALNVVRRFGAEEIGTNALVRLAARAGFDVDRAALRSGASTGRAFAASIGRAA